MDALGFEIVKHALSFLPSSAFEFSNLALVCKKWSFENLSHLIEFDVNSKNVHKIQHLKRAKMITCYQMSSDTFANLSHFTHIRVIRGLLLDMEIFSKCKHLNVKSCGFVMLPPNLEHLVIDGDSKTLACVMTQKLTNLKVLRLNHLTVGKLIFPFTQFPNLETLSITLGLFYQKEQVVFERSTSLKHLRLYASCKGIENLPNLETLEMDALIFDIRDLLHLQNLTHLTLHHYIDPSANQIEMLLQQLPRLQFITLVFGRCKCEDRIVTYPCPNFTFVLLDMFAQSDSFTIIIKK